MAAALPPCWTKASAVSSIRARRRRGELVERLEPASASRSASAAGLEEQQLGEVLVGANQAGASIAPASAARSAALRQRPGRAELARAAPSGRARR